MSELAAGNGIRRSRRQISRGCAGISNSSQIANTQSAPKKAGRGRESFAHQGLLCVGRPYVICELGRSIWTYSRNIGEAVFAHRSRVVCAAFTDAARCDRDTFADSDTIDTTGVGLALTNGETIEIEAEAYSPACVRSQKPLALRWNNFKAETIVAPPWFIRQSSNAICAGGGTGVKC